MKKLKALKAIYTDHYNQTFGEIKINRFIYDKTEGTHKIAFDYQDGIKYKGSMILHSKTGFKYEGEDNTNIEGKFELVFEVFQIYKEYLMLGRWKDKDGYTGDWIIRATSREE